MVFYRTYRPQRISDLDNSLVRETLYAVLSQKTTPHAFLFTGSKGLGKTSAARIVAKVINCERKSKVKSQKSKVEEVEPCNECEQCISITNGTNMDVLEIDGASNRGIDEIRDLREKIRLAPLSSKKKVYIIDEVHMLTTEAFNALLKTLEEPPSHALFVLCTTESHKVPATIVSRCFHIPFSKATQEELTRSLKRIVEGEKIQIDEEALSFIARLSEGSFRDGAKILEHVAALSKKDNITKEFIGKVYNVSNIDSYIKNILHMLSEKDTKKALQLVGQFVSLGVDIKYFIEQLIGELHNQMLVKAGVGKELRIKNLEFRMEEIKKLIELLVQAHGELKYAVLPQLPLELAVIEWGQEESQRNFVSHSASVSDKTPVNSDSVFTWEAFINKVKTSNYSIAGVLRGCKLQSFNDTILVIEAAYKFHKDKLSELKTMTLLEKIAQEITGKEVKVSVLLKSV